MGFRDERWARQNFSERYRTSGADVQVAMEREVIGSAWGANGYTTRAQADELADRLALRPGRRLLDVGAGRGWPGLYLAERSGCEVVLADLPADGLRTAAATARRRNLHLRTSVVVASARALPLRQRSFDAIVHADVLC